MNCRANIDEIFFLDLNKKNLSHTLDISNQTVWICKMKERDEQNRDNNNMQINITTFIIEMKNSPNSE